MTKEIETSAHEYSCLPSHVIKCYSLGAAYKNGCARITILIQRCRNSDVPLLKRWPKGNICARFRIRHSDTELIDSKTGACSPRTYGWKLGVQNIRDLPDVILICRHGIA